MNTLKINGNNPFLPQDIINNILVRLPVKSLIRFQCVCKHWKNLIKSPLFIAEHLHYQNPSLLLEDFGKFDPFRLRLLNRDMKIIDFPNDPFIASSQWCVWIIDSCHGLLCVGVKTFLKHLSILVWNPATRDVREVFRAVDEPEDELFYVGFGFNSTVGDYRVIKICVSDDNYLVHQVEVYSLSTGLWKEIEFGNLDDVAVTSDGYSVNGAIFWIGLKFGDEDEFEDDVNVIVSFDIATEVFALIPTPPSPFSVRVGANRTPFPKYLASHENKLAVMCDTSSGDFGWSLIHLWVLEEGTGSNGERWRWIKMYTSNPYPDFQLNPMTIWRNDIVCFVDRDIDHTEGEVENDERRIVMFNCATNQVKTFDIRKCAHGYGILNYVESLVPIGNIAH